MPSKRLKKNNDWEEQMEREWRESTLSVCLDENDDEEEKFLNEFLHNYLQMASNGIFFMSKSLLTLLKFVNSTQILIALHFYVIKRFPFDNRVGTIYIMYSWMSSYRPTKLYTIVPWKLSTSAQTPLYASTLKHWFATNKEESESECLEL